LKYRDNALTSLAATFREMDNGIGEHSLAHYQEKFPLGGRVRVEARPFLEEFQDEWKYHYPISADQLEAAGMTDTVKGAPLRSRQQT
jgi:hypothetical protein